VKEGDVIQVKDKSRDLVVVLEALDSKERDVPDYLSLDAGKRTGAFLRTPKLADVPYPVQMEPNLVIEFYSR
ncbi:MAG: 30S ribosomal protein S4, partial [Rhodospirillales bacterium]